MPGVDMTPPVPQMPQWRNPNGRLDWLQILDAFVPGNIWNSRTDQFRPLGAAQGLTGLPIDTGYGLFSRLRGSGAGAAVGNAARRGGDFFRNIGRGRGGTSDIFRGDRSWMGPTLAGPSNAVPWVVPDFANTDNWGTRDTDEVDPDWRMPGVRDADPDLYGLGGHSGSSQRALGAGQRFGSQLSFADHWDAMMGRGGALMER